MMVLAVILGTGDGLEQLDVPLFSPPILTVIVFDYLEVNHAATSSSYTNYSFSEVGGIFG